MTRISKMEVLLVRTVVGGGLGLIAILLLLTIVSNLGLILLLPLAILISLPHMIGGLFVIWVVLKLIYG